MGAAEDAERLKRTLEEAARAERAVEDRIRQEAEAARRGR